MEPLFLPTIPPEPERATILEYKSHDLVWKDHAITIAGFMLPHVYDFINVVEVQIFIRITLNLVLLISELRLY